MAKKPESPPTALTDVVPLSITSAMVSTTNDLPGYRVVRGFGVVRGVEVRARNLASAVGAVLLAIGGGSSPVFKALLEETRASALKDMLRSAQAVGGNAVIGMRYDANQSDGFYMVVAYGTAVYVEL